MVTIYTKPDCQQCDATKRAFTRKGIEYNSVDVTVNSSALDFIKSIGAMAVPVVVTETETWFGFRPDKILALARVTVS